jgi:dTDP-4-dehydrorhamnose 3,5-epimerase
MKISPQYDSKIFAQEYGQKVQIEGVEILQLSLQSDDGGNFSELFRLESGMVEGFKTPFEAKQISMSVIVPQTIKAFHIHKKQEDLWYVSPYDRVLVNLHDLRKNSPTFDHHMRFVMGAGKNLLLRIPNGVAHGAANVYERNMMLFYATSEKFDIKNPDEHRLAWDTFGKDKWEITQG